MRRLTVIYDANCAFCLRCARWLTDQPALVEIQIIPSNAADLHRRFPRLDRRLPGSVLIAIADDGSTRIGAEAYLVILHALKHYRPWARRLSRPMLKPLARRAFAMLSSNRGVFSRVLLAFGDRDLARRISKHPESSCPTAGQCEG